MALIDPYENTPERIKEREAEAKKREAWLNENLPLYLETVDENKVFYIKRKDLIDLINNSGALDDIRDSCHRSDLNTMRF